MDKPNVKSHENLEETKLTEEKRVRQKDRTETEVEKTAVFCICRKPDNGSKMVLCENCEEWFHLNCIKLNVKELEEMNRKKQQYVCKNCAVFQKEGIRGNQGKQQLKEKFELNQRKLNAKIAEQQEEIKRLKRREEERKVKETEEKTEHKRKLATMRETLETRNKRITDLKVK